MAHPDPLLLALAAGHAVTGERDSRGLVDSAVEHRMTGLLWSAVERGEVVLSPDERQRLSVVDMANRLREQQIERALVEAVRRARGLGIELVTFKGVTAARRWYDRPGERPTSDLDLLVAPHDRARYAEIVRALNPTNDLLRDLTPEELLDWAVRDQAMNVRLEADLGAQTWSGQPVTIDLHVDLLKYGIPGRQAEEIWAHTHLFELDGGETVRVLDAEVALVHLLLHMNRDRFAYLIAYADVARLLRREPIDWQYVHQFVAREGLDVPVYASLDAVTQSLGITVPAHPPIGGWRALLWKRLWSPRVRLQGLEGRKGIRRRRRWLPVMARGRAIEGMSAWIRGTS
ncbi:MAG: nucleotidyltransferase family protein [Dehalococcoidia bacterium]|nr:nucleotidyltransferase family protein [Dehalococcoidia bacterium]MCB9490488.1 nucleotidyltransferase family protein [Dehalococcoidia bacterium]